MAEKPRVLVLERTGSPDGATVMDRPREAVEVVHARSMSRALALLRDGRFDGVYVDGSQLDAVRWVGMVLQAEEILDAISDGVAVVDPDLRIVWANPEFLSFTATPDRALGERFYQALAEAEILGPEPCPFTTAVARRGASSTVVRIRDGRYLRVSVTPVFDARDALTHLIALAREITDETKQQQKIDAIARAGDELADLGAEELSRLGAEERTDLLKYNIARHMKDLMGLDFIQVRLLDRGTGRLTPLLTEGMTPTAASMELTAAKEGQGVTGLVAATGQSYLCPDTSNDPYYLQGAENARSSLTIPLVHHGAVIGTLNVESDQTDAFDDRDRQFLEIYGRNIASALNTLELLQAEKASTASASVQAISREVALPLDDVITDAVTVLDRYAGHDEDVVARLRHLLYRAREIRGIIQKVGAEIAPPPPSHHALQQPAARLAGVRLLVVDAEEAVLRSAHQLLGMQGATVETARDAAEAAAMVRQGPYSAALADIRLPDMDGYAVFKLLRELQPELPVILMTGFGYDPSHSIVKARQEGLQTVLYKPFRSDRLMDAVEQALKIQAVKNDGAAAADGPTDRPSENHKSS